MRTSYLICLPLVVYALFSVKALAPRRGNDAAALAPSAAQR